MAAEREEGQGWAGFLRYLIIEELRLYKPGSLKVAAGGSSLLRLA